jgi:hypothetical protein
MYFDSIMGLLAATRRCTCERPVDVVSVESAYHSATANSGRQTVAGWWRIRSLPTNVLERLASNRGMDAARDLRFAVRMLLRFQALQRSPSSVWRWGWARRQPFLLSSML